MKFYQELAKVERVLNSCKTVEQYKVAKNMIKVLGEKYKYDLVEIRERGGCRKNEMGMMVLRLSMRCDKDLMNLNKPMDE